MEFIPNFADQCLWSMDDASHLSLLTIFRHTPRPRISVYSFLTLNFESILLLFRYWWSIVCHHNRRTLNGIWFLFFSFHMPSLLAALPPAFAPAEFVALKSLNFHFCSVLHDKRTVVFWTPKTKEPTKGSFTFLHMRTDGRAPMYVCDCDVAQFSFEWFMKKKKKVIRDFELFKNFNKQIFVEEIVKLQQTVWKVYAKNASGEYSRARRMRWMPTSDCVIVIRRIFICEWVRCCYEGIIIIHNAWNRRRLQCRTGGRCLENRTKQRLFIRYGNRSCRNMLLYFWSSGIKNRQADVAAARASRSTRDVPNQSVGKSSQMLTWRRSDSQASDVISVE